ncbi:MAG TPA: hypothetical protein VF215_07710 [Thermoanaerobaculia bacterium]
MAERAEAHDGAGEERLAVASAPARIDRLSGIDESSLGSDAHVPFLDLPRAVSGSTLIVVVLAPTVRR